MRSTTRSVLVGGWVVAVVVASGWSYSEEAWVTDPHGETRLAELARPARLGVPDDGEGETFGVAVGENHWRRTVSPAPATATFADVPTGHLIFQYVEALAASGITAGCGGGNSCPDQPVTRGQMAVFLAKALGLHWFDF